MMKASSSRVERHPCTVVTIPSCGHIEGVALVDRTTSQVKGYRYTEIPYAQPPVGDLRWRRPQPLASDFRYDQRANHDTKQKTYNGFGNPDSQVTDGDSRRRSTTTMVSSLNRFNGSEDCLQLHIWTPVISSSQHLDENETIKSNRLPVLFYLDTSWLQIGNACFEPNKDPIDLLRHAGLDCIVVAAGYRSNVFGFLAHDALREEDADGITGNYGLWDQRMALEWVHTHIHHFGGDPNNMTVTGMSTGIYDSHFQLLHEFHLSQQNLHYRPIFRRVLLPPNVNSNWPAAKSVEQVTDQLDRLSMLLNVPLSLSPGDKIRRLRTIPYDKIVDVLPQMTMHSFGVVRDAAFVSNEATAAMAGGRFAQWCEQNQILFHIGETQRDETLYQRIHSPLDLTNSPSSLSDKVSLMSEQSSKSDQAKPQNHTHHHHHRNNASEKDSHRPSIDDPTNNLPSPDEFQDLYAVLGVKRNATQNEIRTAYLTLVRKHHPDKISVMTIPSQGQNDCPATTTSPQASPPDSQGSHSDQLIRALNHAYSILNDESLRTAYDDSVALAAASVANRANSSQQPRISATIDFESLQPNSTQQGTYLFTYPCRCGSSYTLTETQLQQDSLTIVGCDGCSEFIRVVIEESQGEEEEEEKGQDTNKPWSTFYQNLCADLQVYLSL